MCFCTAHPHEAEVAVNLDHETHLYQHLLDDRHYVRHLRPAAAHNDSVVVDVQLAVTAVAGLVSSKLAFSPCRCRRHFLVSIIVLGTFSSVICDCGLIAPRRLTKTKLNSL